jgi:hypothetical protein
MDWPGLAAAALVATPKQKDVLHCDPTPEQRGIIAVAGKKDIFRAHGARNADRDCLLAERRGIGPEPAGALQGYGLQIKGAGQCHAAVYGDNQVVIGCKIWKIAEDRTIGREIGAPTHFKPCDHRKLFLNFFHRVPTEGGFASHDRTGQRDGKG